MADERAQLLAEIEVLTERLERLHRQVANERPDADEPVTRRGLLRSAGLALAAGGVGALASGATPAAATTGDPVLVGHSASAGTYTGIDSTGGGTALYATSQATGLSYTAAVVGDSQATHVGGVGGLSHGIGVYGVSTQGTVSTNGLTVGVLGDAAGGTGVQGSSDTGIGVVASSFQQAAVSASGETYGVDATGAVGVRGIGLSTFSSPDTSTFVGVHGRVASDGLHPGGGGIGVHGEVAKLGSATGVASGGCGVYGVAGAASGTAGNAGVVGDSTTRPGVGGFSGSASGVYGQSKSGPGITGHGLRGAVLQGSAAQARLVPSTSTTHPAGGSAGDLFVDTSARLWFCKTTSTSSAHWVQLA